MRKNKTNKILVISPKPDTFLEYFKKIWDYRNLIWVFAQRDIKVKYAQTMLGITWTILQPLTALVIYTVFFGVILNWTAGDIPFPIYVLSGLIGWNFFSYIVYAGSSSVQDASFTIKKIYFPKSILPLSKVLVAFIELVFSLFLLIPLMLYYGIPLSWHIVFFPVVIIYNTCCGLLLVFWVASFAYKKKDLFHLLPYIVSFGMWLTPVFFTGNFLPEKLKLITVINPMANVVDLWRWLLFNNIEFNLIWLFNFVIVLFLSILGMYNYNKKEGEFADFV
jgi:lipopolysaccharide transport system permease protein